MYGTHRISISRWRKALQDMMRKDNMESRKLLLGGPGVKVAMDETCVTKKGKVGKSTSGPLATRGKYSETDNQRAVKNDHMEPCRAIKTLT